MGLLVGRRVLVIDDHEDARQMMRVLLSRLGCDVFLAEDGHSGVAAATSLRPDVVFIDIALPDLDGYQVAAALRTVLGSSARLVALSGHRKRDDDAVAGCFDDYLVKPVEPELIARFCTA